MNFKKFMNMYDNWNGRTRVNDDNLETIVEDITAIVADDYPELWNKEVIAFGFIENILTVRIK